MTADSNFDAKFGQAPIFAYIAPPAHVVLLGQAAVNAAVLMIVQPSFIVHRQTTESMPRLHLPTLLSVVGLSGVATWLLHVSGATPGDTFRNGCKFMYRAIR